MSLQTELKLRKPIKEPAHEALLNVYYTASRIKKEADVFFSSRGLTDVQFNVLALLSEQSGQNGGLTQVALSRMMLVNRANVTSLIDRMEKANLVVRAPVSNDRRYNVVKLTPRGRRKYEQTVGNYREKVSEIMQVLGKKELKNLVSALERVRSNIGVTENSVRK